MATDKEQEYISALQDFSKSLDYLVKAIQTQVKNNKQGSFKDKVSNTKDDAKELAETAEELNVITENTTKTKSNTDEILDIVKGIKSEKKTGIWDKLSGAKDKTKTLAEGIKSIALMAGAILAVGSAFKIIGSVDFSSVLALSIALPLVAMAFNEVGQTIHSPKESALIAFSMIAMSAGLLGSGLILKMMPNISLSQLMSATGVGIAMGLAMVPLAFAAKHIGNNVKSLLLIGPVLPLIAWGITMASHELTKTDPISLTNILSAAGVGIAIGLALIPLAFAGKIIGNNIKHLYSLSVFMPVLAGAIYLSALELSNMPEVDLMKTIKTSLGVTAALVIFGAGIWAFDKLGINVATAVKGSIAMIAVAGAIMVTSKILALGDYSNPPSLEWALNAGVVLIGGGLIAAALGLGISLIIPGIAGMLLVAGGIMASSQVLALGNYKDYPSLEWAKGAGLALGGFGIAALALGAVISTGVGAIVLGLGVAGMIGLSAGIVEVSDIISKGNYTGGPSEAWAKGVAMALMAFATPIEKLGSDMFGDSLNDKIDGVKKLGIVLADVSNIISKGNYTTGPSAEWALGVGLSINSFATALNTLDVSADELKDKMISTMSIANIMAYFGTKMTGINFGNYPKAEWVNGISQFMSTFSDLDVVSDAEDASKQIAMLANSYIKLAGSLNVLGQSMQGITSAPDLTGLYGGIVTLSLVDSGNLEDTLDTLTDKKDDFKNVLSMIQAQSNVKIDESTFAFNKDKSSTSKSSSTPSTSSSTGPSSNMNAAILPVKAQQKPLATVVNPNAKQESLLTQLVNMMGQMNGSLGEIADNTGHKLSQSNIIDN